MHNEGMILEDVIVRFHRDDPSGGYQCIDMHGNSPLPGSAGILPDPGRASLENA